MPPTYRVWGADKVVYGPVELPTLVAWVKDERVLPATWVCFEPEDRWIQAHELTELKALFAGTRAGVGATAPGGAAPSSRAGIRPGTLRRMKLLADLEPAQLESFIRYFEVMHVAQFSPVVQVGELGHAMYLVLEGELRARVLVDGRETTLSTMTTGDFFGEISLLDRGPRSADVLANQDSVLLKVSATQFELMAREAPALALPFLLALSRSVVARVRTLTRRYQDSIHFSRAASA
jgi:hypothetical protein